MNMSKTVMFVIALIMIRSATVLAQTQAALSKEAQNEYQKADAELNRVYGLIVKRYKQDSLFVQKLAIAQRAWIAFRDAHLDAVYPEQDKQRAYGTVYPMCRWYLLTNLTNERIKELKIWIEGVEEGDTCRGSRKSKE